MKKKDVLEYFGGVTNTARALNLAHQSVSEWPEQIPQARAYEIEELTKGALKVKRRKIPLNEYNNF